MTIETYRVVREHEGDRFYLAGEERAASPADVGHLIPHVLVKAEPAIENKAIVAAPANKSNRKGKLPATGPVAETGE